MKLNNVKRRQVPFIFQIRGSKKFWRNLVETIAQNCKTYNFFLFLRKQRRGIREN